jgi:DNA-binding transcriptional LysR family regulator
MTDLDPSWLRSFVAIAQAGSVTRAAQQVHRTQSAVSTHLQQLEAAVGARLVERTTRSLALTQEGERLLPHAHRLLELQAQARASVLPAAAQQPVLRVGISEYFFPSRLGELLAVLRAAAPLARFELMWSTSAPLLQLWRGGAMDLAVVTSKLPVPGARLLRREPLAWVSAPGHMPPADLPTPLVLLGPDCPVREIALTALVRSGRAHHVQLSCTGSQAAVAAIRAGWGVGCLNASAIPHDLDVWKAERAPRWPSPGRLAFYLLARPDAREAAQAVRQWAA